MSRPQDFSPPPSDQPEHSGALERPATPRTPPPGFAPGRSASEPPTPQTPAAGTNADASNSSNGANPGDFCNLPLIRREEGPHPEPEAASQVPQTPSNGGAPTAPTPDNVTGYARPLPSEGGLPSAAELEQTLRRLMERVSMMVRAEKCVFLLHDRERHELVARPPALGFSRDQIRALRLSAEHGIVARAFQGRAPIAEPDAASLEGRDANWVRNLEARNFIAYPLVLERRDEQERIADRITVGVFLVLNKRAHAPFTDGDLKVLANLAHQVTAIIAEAQVYLQLTEEKDQLQATLQSLGSAVLMVEPSGHISLLNTESRALFGLREDEGVGQPFEEVVQQEELLELLRDAVNNGKEGQVEIEMEWPGNHVPRIYQAQTALVRGEKGGAPAVLGVATIFNDITEIRNVERMKTAFVSTVSHELRTPLTSIKGFISTLLQDTDGYFDSEMRQEFYEIIDTECDRLRRLIDDLLNVSRIESGRALQMNWALFEPLPVIEKVLQAQRSYTDKHKLILDFEGEVPQLLGDADKFDQILTNLLSNAIKYSPNGGEVRVKVDATSDELLIRISDQGIGIPRDKLPRIFEKFERVDNRDTRQAGGTGIGLFLVHHLVERHQGTIIPDSELGKGTTFKIRLPLRPNAAIEDMNQID